MNTDIEKMHKTWDSLLIDNRRPTELPAIKFNEILSSIFATGLFYYYIIDFFDMTISHLSKGFAGTHGINPGSIKNINDILSLIHPDDIGFVSKAEKKACDFLYKEVGPEKLTRYKASYNFRFKTSDGYRLFNHQALILTMDENNNFIKSLNIHTDISHITQRNNHKFSIIGLDGESSYLNIDVEENNGSVKYQFSKRELEVVKLISKGYSSQQIADLLHITTDTVKTHRKNILTKAGCKNASELIAMSMSEGWI
jgi:DNA-binding CsgD family transcriptional regulator